MVDFLWKPQQEGDKEKVKEGAGSKFEQPVYQASSTFSTNKTGNKWYKLRNEVRQIL